MAQIWSFEAVSDDNMGDPMDVDILFKCLEAGWNGRDTSLCWHRVALMTLPR